MKTILFFPSDMGGGFGHVGRSLDLASKCRQAGCKAVFALNAFHADKVASEGYETHLLRWARARWTTRLLKKLRKPPAGSPVFYAVNGLDYQAVRDGIYSPEIAASRLDDCLGIIDAVKPDLLVGDTHLFVRAAGEIRRIPVVQIVRSAVHPDARPRKAPRGGEEVLARPAASKVFNGLLSERGLGPIRRAEELLRGDRVLIPSIHEVDPMPEKVQSPTAYIGTLVYREKAGHGPFDPGRLFADQRPLVYITIGGGAGPEGGGWLFELFERVTQAVRANFILSVGSRHDPSRLTGFGANTALFSWVRALDVLAESDAVLFSGGYGTVMTVLSAGKPSLVLPAHSDPEWNGRRIQALGAGLLLFPFSDEMDVTALPEPLGGTAGIYRTPALKPETVIAALNRLLNEASFREKAGGIARRISAYKKEKAEAVFRKMMEDLL
jgi:UDP:flavonoid glycosyltransferase YjiC (YdhE family)